jgi:hypothetical protein
MKYLVNKETKEHRIDRIPEALPAEAWYRVEADDEGWIKHTRKECPLPDDARCEYIMRSRGKSITAKRSGILDWSQGNERYHITHYRPILEQAEPIPAPQYDPRSVSFKPNRLFDDLLERLEASHAAAQALPDLVAQLRDRLKPLGLGVMYLSEFDAVEPEAAVETPQDDKYKYIRIHSNLVIKRHGAQGG